MYIVIENLFKKRAGFALNKNIFSRFFVFTLVSISWVFFRANTINDALYIIKSMFVDHSVVINKIITNKSLLGLKIFPIDIKYISLCIILIFVLIILESFHERSTNIYRKWNGISGGYRWLTYYACLFVLYFLGVYEKNQFIYFQF